MPTVNSTFCVRASSSRRRGSARDACGPCFQWPLRKPEQSLHGALRRAGVCHEIAQSPRGTLSSLFHAA